MKLRKITPLVGKTLYAMLGFTLGHLCIGAEMEITLELLDEPLSLWWSPSYATRDISADGSVIVGYRGLKGLPYPHEETEAFLWKDGNFTVLGYLSDDERDCVANGVSADGSVVVGWSGNPNIEAFRWENGVMVGLGVLPGADSSRAYAISADGSTIVGESDNVPCMWKDGVLTSLAVLPNDEGGMARAVSADGSVIVGQSGSWTKGQPEAVFWENGVVTGLGMLPGMDSSVATAVSADGTLIFGHSGNLILGHSEPGLSPGVFRWENGTMTALRDLPGATRAHRVNSVTGDGSVVLGTIMRAGPSVVLWLEPTADDPVLLDDLLNEAGIELGTDQYTDMGNVAISLDGTTICGNFTDASYGGACQPFRVRFGGSLAPVLEILQPPQSYTAEPDSTATLTVITSGIEDESFEWIQGGTVVGEDSPTLTLRNVQAADAGQYTVVVTVGEDSVTSRSVTLGVKAPPYTEKLLNISTRGQILDGAKVLIAGFVLEGTGQKNVLIRGIGPGLGQWVDGVCTDPKLELFRVGDDSSTPMAANEAWGYLGVDVLTICRRVGAFSLKARSKDAALHMALEPGAYTAKVTPLDGFGVGLVELYDADPDLQASTCQVANISTRGEVGVDAEILIAGFIVAGDVPKQVLVRGVGPGLGEFGVDGVLVNPVLKLYKDADPDPLWVATNNNWSDNANAADIVTAGTAAGAFDLEAGSKDAAILTWLEPGSYTAQVSGIGITTGVALVEVYGVD